MRTLRVTLHSLNSPGDEDNPVITLVAVGLLLFSFTAVMDQEVQVATTVAFTEGPTADAAGSVFFTDQVNNRIMKTRSV